MSISAAPQSCEFEIVEDIKTSASHTHRYKHIFFIIGVLLKNKWIVVINIKEVNESSKREAITQFLRYAN